MRLLTTAALLLLATAGAPAAPDPSLQATLVRWIDGDTAVVHVAGSGRTTVRLIGIDAPEASLSPRASDQARRLGVPVQHILLLGRAARDRASTLAPPGSAVRLELDVQTHDRYGRLLAYMWRLDGRMVNEELLRQGWALLLTVPPNVRHAHRLRAAQQEARVKGLGLWSGQPTRPDSSMCDPSYPDVCIPPPPPDLDCRDIPYRRFRVLPPDPHGFDRDRDGVGCER